MNWKRLARVHPIFAWFVFMAVILAMLIDGISPIFQATALLAVAALGILSLATSRELCDRSEEGQSKRGPDFTTLMVIVLVLWQTLLMIVYLSMSSSELAEAKPILGIASVIPVIVVYWRYDSLSRKYDNLVKSGEL